VSYGEPLTYWGKFERIYLYLDREATGAASSEFDLVRFPPLAVLDPIESKISSICISARRENKTTPAVAH
jgi:hypothetical protein